jgi:DNA helicase-2/ATP-dependent DNA helicase PcrA
MPDSLQRSLNSEQAKAVNTIEGPVLILAGAGSGKTRVITHRIAWMLAQGISPTSILAVTFTNKAAREMAQRVRSLCRSRPGGLTIATFHAFGVLLLKESGALLGYRPHFSIYDSGDKQSLIKELCHELKLSEDPLEIKKIAVLFSRLKTGQQGFDDGSRAYRVLYDEYARRLKLLNAVDFDDLIRLPTQILENYPEARQKYHERYRYMLVDEFQDTSLLQYKLMHLLSSGSRSICVVGDDDQSIYSWRGASSANIKSFENDFPERLEIKLEQNYRSTRTILQAANALIANNTGRKSKKLWSDGEEGSLIQVGSPEDEKQEAEFIAEKIRSLSLRNKIPLRAFGVLVRTNVLTRSLEEAFRRDNLPYKVSGGTSFFLRKEVKDIIAYLRVLANPDDDVNLLRILNMPRRGLGRKFLEISVGLSREKNCSLYTALKALEAAEDSPLHHHAAATLEDFLALVENGRRKMLSGQQMAQTLSALIDEINFWGHLLAEHKNGNLAKWKYENVLSLVSSLAAYEQDPDVIEPSLFKYLQQISLNRQEDDQMEEEDRQGKVNLMTIHAAKGLEFRVVFVAGCEEGVIPHARAMSENESNLEEERRLFYVAMTRARDQLFLSAPRTRRWRGQSRESTPSPFIDELPREHLEFQEEEETVTPEDASGYFRTLKDKLS